MRITREHVAEAPRQAAALVPHVNRPAAFLVLVAGGSALAVGGGSDLIRALGLLAAVAGSWLLATAYRPAPDAGLQLRLRELTRERDQWARIAERLSDTADERVGWPAAPRREPPDPASRAALDAEELHDYTPGGGRPGRLAALPADHDAEGDDPDGADA